MILGVVILNVAVFSPGLLGVEIGGDALESASGVTLLFISLLVVLYTSYSSLIRPPAVQSGRDQPLPEDYTSQLKRYQHVDVLNPDVALAVDQLERIGRKKSALDRTLAQRFEPAELSSRKFHSVIAGAEQLFLLNIRGIVNRLSLFDTSEFALFTSNRKSSRFSEKLIRNKNALYSDFFAAVKGYLNANEEILLKLDQLLLEISALDGSQYTEVEELPCIQELNALIKQTKLYQ